VARIDFIKDVQGFSDRRADRVTPIHELAILADVLIEIVEQLFWNLDAYYRWVTWILSKTNIIRFDRKEITPSNNECNSVEITQLRTTAGFDTQWDPQHRPVRKLVVETHRHRTFHRLVPRRDNNST